MPGGKPLVGNRTKRGVQRGLQCAAAKPFVSPAGLADLVQRGAEVLEFAPGNGESLQIDAGVLGNLERTEIGSPISKGPPAE